MARTNVAVSEAPGGDSDSATAATPVAADTVNLNECKFHEGMILLAYNSSGGALTVTVTSSPDERGRTNDISALSLAAGKLGIFGPFTRKGWIQAGGKLFFQGSAAGILFTPMKAPRL